MANYSLQGWFDTSQTVTPQFFGGNTVGSYNTENGTPTNSFQAAVENLGVGALRYPAGQPEEAYSEGMIIDGALPEHFRNFMDWAKENNQTVVVVTPTKNSYPGSAELEQFAELAAEEYGDIIEAFEIGNEYWGHIGEQEYGEIANESAQSINNGLEAAGQDIDIWVQMANPSGIASDYGSGNGGWIDRTLSANQEIIDQLSLESLSIIDGVVDHYYLNKSDLFSLFNDVTNFIALDISIWRATLGQDTTLNITEWNIKASNDSLLGIKAASAMIMQFSFMMELGVDSAFVWPLQHNTANDLAGSWDRDVIVGSDGIVTNSVGGATYSMMVGSLAGKNLLLPSFSNSGNDIKFDMFGNSDEVVLYVSSQILDARDINLLMQEFGLELTLTQTRKITYDRTTSDGVYYDNQTNSWENAESIDIDGEDYYLNEHDVQAQIIYYDNDDVLVGDEIQFTLNPFEVVELTFAAIGSIEHTGSVGSGNIEGTIFADRIDASNGSEYIMSFSGDDYIAAKMGDDHIVAGKGNDVVFGGAGDDILAGGLGHDRLFGNLGHDVIQGGYGNDLIRGGSGNDEIRGGSGNDEIRGGSGNDLLFGGNGSDKLFGWKGNDLIRGGSGNDEIRGGSGSDTLFGGEGADRLDGGAGNDILFGGAEDGASDEFIFSGQFGNDLVVGFEFGVDMLVFHGVATEFSDLVFSKATSGLLISDGRSTVLIENADLGSISESDVIFDL